MLSDWICLGKPRGCGGCLVETREYPEADRPRSSIDSSHALLHATIESTTEAILATDEEGKPIFCNARFNELWQTDRTSEGPMLAIADEVKDKADYLQRLKEISKNEPDETQDLLELTDGRTIERFSRAQRGSSGGVGRVWTFRDVTDRVKAEETSSRLAAIIESSDDAIISKTLKGIITTWNKGAERVFGYTAPEVIGKSIEILIPAERLAEEPEILRKLKCGERIDHYETIRVRKDGMRIDISISVSPVRDASGRIIGVSKIARDITERKQVEQALRDEAQVLEFVNKTGNSISAQLDLQSLVQLVTDTATQITGAQFGAFFYNVIDESGEAYTLYSLSGATQEDFENFGTPRNTPVFNPTFQGEGVVRSADITKDPRYGAMAPHHGMPKGHLPVKSYLAVPVNSGSGEVIGGLFFGHPEPNVFNERAEKVLVAIAAQAAIAIDNARLYEAAQREIAERSRVESALRDSEQHLRAIFSQAAVGIAEADLDGRFIEMNGKFCEILGYSAEELGKLTFFSITHPDDLVGTQKYIKELMAGEIDHQVTEKRYIRKDRSEVWCLTTVTLIKDREGKPQQYVGVIEDITSRKEAGGS
jgi:PAS domain S-box-containing protein